MPESPRHNNPDHQVGNWWATVSGAGTDAAAVESWADDYTRHRSGMPEYTSTTYGTASSTHHSATNQPTNFFQGRVKTGRELDASKL